MLLCIATLGLSTSCSKENDKDKDLIVGTWKIIEGTSFYTDYEGNLQDAGLDIGTCIGYAENGDYFSYGRLGGKWERINNESILVIKNGESRVEKILILTDEHLKITYEYIPSDDGYTHKVTMLMKRQ